MYHQPCLSQGYINYIIGRLKLHKRVPHYIFVKIVHKSFFVNGIFQRIVKAYNVDDDNDTYVKFYFVNHLERVTKS